MADVCGTACMWTGLGHEHRPRYYAPVNQLMLIMGHFTRLKRQFAQSSTPRHRTLSLHAPPTQPWKTSRDRCADGVLNAPVLGS
jgi:hypothetical protein